MTADPTCRRNSIAGFTLLEALVATALMAMILAALATITAQWLPNWNRGVSRLQRSEHLAIGLDRLVSDLAAAEFVPAGRGRLQPVFDGNDLSVTFVRAGLAPDALPTLEIVRIAEIRGDHGPMVVRTRAPFAPAIAGANDGNQPKLADPVVLLRAPYRLSFSYAGADRVWRGSWKEAMQLPKAIKITVLDAATQQVLAASTALLVHAELPAACIVAKSLAECHASLRGPSVEGGKPRDVDNGRTR
jgi:general secretion pathway protein J